VDQLKDQNLFVQANLFPSFTHSRIRFICYIMKFSDKTGLLGRRTFLAQVASSIAAFSAASPTLAAIELGASSQLLTLSDGYLNLPPEMVFGSMPQAELSVLLADHGLDVQTYTPACNVTLFRDGENTVLFDVGAGPDFMETAGQLPESLQSIGMRHEEVTHVIFTHAHPDHIWGLLDDFDEPLFPDATYMMGESEWDYWWNPETVNRIGEDRAAFAVGARRRMEVIEDVVIRFKDGQELLPGIAARASFGHTPGHMAFEVRRGGEAIMIVGDALGNPHVAFERPDWHSGTDQDPETAVKARRSLLDQIASDNMRIVGFHLPSGGIGRVERKDSAYRFFGEPA
jgi:glyoxylase-like metal-dependent hydrolase (beta-lactamase superfamily II)